MVGSRGNMQQLPQRDEYVLLLKSVFGVVARRFWIIALAGILFGGVAVGLSILQTPQYQASARILVGQDQGITNSPNDTLGFQQLTQTMAVAADSRQILAPVAERFNIDIDDFEDNFSAGQISATQFIEIAYTDSDPDTAREVANALAGEFSEQIDRVSGAEGEESQITATTWGSAETPDEPVSPEPVRNGILALFFGVALGVGIAFLMEFFDDSWASPEEAEQISGVPTFGIIPEFGAEPSSRKALSGSRRRGRDDYDDEDLEEYEIRRDEPEEKAAIAKFEFQEFARNGDALWPVGVVVVGLDGLLKESNSSFRRMVGFSEEELRDAPFAEFASHPDDVEEHARLQGEAVSGGRDHYQVEKRLVKKDGQLMWVRMTVSAPRDEKGEARFVIGMVEEVTAQKQTEERLRLSEEAQRLWEERLRTVVGKSPLVVHSFTPEGHRLMGNGTWDGFWRGGREETEDISVFEDEEVRSTGLTRYIEESVSGKESVTTPPLKVRRSHPESNGNSAWIQAFIHPLVDDAGRLFEFVVMIEDVTARERAERELKETRRRFKTFVEQLTDDDEEGR